MAGPQKSRSVSDLRRYLTRDISELLNRHGKYNFDNMIYVIASEQDLHVKQFFKASRGA